jgi:hypothetical protein
VLFSRFIYTTQNIEVKYLKEGDQNGEGIDKGKTTRRKNEAKGRTKNEEKSND